MGQQALVNPHPVTGLMLLTQGIAVVPMGSWLAQAFPMVSAPGPGLPSRVMAQAHLPYELQAGLNWAEQQQESAAAQGWGWAIAQESTPSDPAPF